MALKPSFILLCGPSGSGKSYYAENYLKRQFKDCVVLSSDAIRGEIYGDENCQKDPQRVFDIMNRRTLDAIARGVSVIYDATNLKERFRIHLLGLLKRYDCHKEAMIFSVDPKICIERQNMRDRKVPAEVIWNQIKSFQPPHPSEGWDIITWGFVSFLDDKQMEDYMKLAKGFVQYNPHHELTLDEHLVKAARHAQDEYMGSLVHNAALFHDFGKVFTQEFKGEVAHYYNHENVSAYFYPMLSGDYSLDVMWLIAHHMDRFKGERYRQKVKERLGEKYKELLGDLVMLEECDICAH